MAIKRKGSDFTTNMSAAAVVSVASSSDTAAATTITWEDTKRQLHQVRLQADFNDIFGQIQSLQQQTSSLTDDDFDEITQVSHEIQSQLLVEIQKERELHAVESDDLYKAQVELQDLQAHCDSLQDEVVFVNEKITNTKESIYQAQQVVLEETQGLSDVELQQMMEVPRLKEQISMYATTTGIKWNYDEEDVLAGQVAVPELKTLRRFSIDPKEHSPFEVANYLWNAMEGEAKPVAVE